MAATAPARLPALVDRLRRRGLRRVLASPVWLSLLPLAPIGGFAILASCSSGSTSSPSAPAWPANQDAAAPAPTSSSWGDASSPPPGWGADAGSETGAGGTPPPPPGLDYSVFASTIQPILDTAGGGGCTNTSCHGAASGIGGFVLSRLPAAGTPAMQANFQAVSALCNLSVPDQSTFYLQATNSHAGVAVSQAQASTILTWIQHASGSGAPPGGAPGADAGGTTCIPASSFDLGVFAAEIQPMLFGTLDYNVPPGQPVANNGCARAVCHGASTNPLNISTKNTPVQNLTNLSCFVNLTNPSASPILLCPLNAPGCPKSPHPGQDVFASPQDLNYQRLMSWLYSVVGAANPLDLAFFARQIAPIFDDPASGGIVGGQRTCADTNSCHGVSAAGQAPPNLSNFPILADAVTLQGIKTNYWTAANFVNFLTPTGSELFLYPTNLVANTTNQPYATGQAHAGGIDFAPNSAQAQAILSWAGGLQLDGNGDMLNWLVAGTYDVSLVSQPTEVGNDAAITPTIFDPDGASQFNAGVWDLDSSANEFVDFNAEFPGTPGSGRVAYAVAYAINATGTDIQQAQVNVNSPNAVQLYVGSESTEGSQGGANTVNLSATLTAYSTARASTRILVKVLQRPGDNQFGFTLNMTQQNGQLFPAGQLIFRMDPKGGI
jgi:hypothetical protein